MTVIIANKLNQFRQWGTKIMAKDRLMKLAEVFFFLLPTLFLVYHYLMAALSQQDFFQLLISHPKYTIQFMTYSSYYFVSLLFRLLGRLIAVPEESSLVKLVLLAILVSQLLSLNFVVAAVVWIVIRQLFHRQIVQLNFREVVKSKQKWLLLLGFFLVLVSGSLAVMTRVLS